jgi:hypothetical protein
MRRGSSLGVPLAIVLYRRGPSRRSRPTRQCVLPSNAHRFSRDRRGPSPSPFPGSVDSTVASVLVSALGVRLDQAGTLATWLTNRLLCSPSRDGRRGRPSRTDRQYPMHRSYRAGTVLLYHTDRRVRPWITCVYVGPREPMTAISRMIEQGTELSIMLIEGVRPLVLCMV